MSELDLPGTLRRVRRVADLSQRELARRLGLSKSAVAAAESGTAGMDVRRLAAAASLAGLRLMLVDDSGIAVAAMTDHAVRDRAWRRFPAHLDTHVGDDVLDQREYRRDRTFPTYTFVRDRGRRDAQRSRHGGAPEDHLVPRPGDSPAERRAARHEALRRRQATVWERRRDAGGLPALPDWICDCPPECVEDEDGTRSSHAEDCVCRCDLG